MAFGRAGAGEYGTYFVGYAADPGVIEHMLVPTADFLENPMVRAAGSLGSGKRSHFL